MLAQWVVNILSLAGALTVAIIAAIIAGTIASNSHTRMEAWKELFSEKRRASQRFLKAMGDFSIFFVLGKDLNLINKMAMDDGDYQLAVTALRHDMRILERYMDSEDIESIHSILQKKNGWNKASFDEHWEEAMRALYLKLLIAFNKIDEEAREARIQLSLVGHDVETIMQCYISVATDVNKAFQDGEEMFSGFDSEEIEERIANTMNKIVHVLREDLQKSAQSLDELLGVE